MESDQIEKDMESVDYSAIVAIANEIGSTSKKILVREVANFLDNKDVSMEIKGEVMPYLYAAGFLSFAGRQVDEGNLRKAVMAIGVTPNKDIIDMIISMGIHSHMIYVYTFYFLIANGRETSKENIKKVVKTLGIPVDEMTLNEALVYIKEDM